MAGTKRKISEALFQKWIKEGRGQGRQQDYKPWLTVRDVPSEGRVHRIFGSKSQRTHHLLSDLELSVFFILEWHSEITEIREQFPLLRDETLSIAKNAGIKHPMYQGVKSYISSDFLVNTTFSDESKLALQVKSSSALDDKRTVEKLEIERRYWLSKNIPWYIVTEKEIPQVVTKNIDWLYSSIGQIDEGIISIDQLRFYAQFFEENPNKTLIEICKELDQAYELPLGESLREVKYILAKRYFTFDIFTPVLKLKAKNIQVGNVGKVLEVYRVSNQ